MNEYQLMRDSKPTDRKNDCGVISVAIATQSSYEHVEKLFAELGRNLNRGVYLHQIVAACRILTGLDCIKSNLAGRQRNGSRFTMKTIGKQYPRGRYIVTCDGHVAALVDGQIMDWTAGRRHRVISIIAVSC
jgi:hypothetical protein